MEKQNYRVVLTSDATHDTSEHIQHYGVKGMKWDVVKTKQPIPTGPNPRSHLNAHPTNLPWTPTSNNMYHVMPQSKPSGNTGSNHKIPKRDPAADAKSIADLLTAFKVTDPRSMDDTKKDMVRNWVQTKTWDLPNDYAIRYRKDFSAEMKKLGFDVDSILDGSQQGSTGHGPYGSPAPASTTSNTQPYVSPEYQAEVAFNSQSNVYPSNKRRRR